MKQKERSINELLQILLDNINIIKTHYPSGLCDLLHFLTYVEKKITLCEAILIKNYLYNNKPFNFVTLMHLKNDKVYYFWKRDSIQPRINWLKKHIKKTSNNEK